MRARVLIVDDDELYLAGMQEWLELAGYEVIVANTFEHGKRAMVNFAPHLMIVDVRLGAFNGLQLISTVRSGFPSSSSVALMIPCYAPTRRRSVPATWRNPLCQVPCSP